MSVGGRRADHALFQQSSFGTEYATKDAWRKLVCGWRGCPQPWCSSETLFSSEHYGGRSRLPAGDARHTCTLDPTATYRVTVNSFLADGGDGFKILKSGVDRVGGALDVNALTGYLGAHSPVAPPALGRVTKL